MFEHEDAVLQISGRLNGFVTVDAMRAAGLPRSVLEGGKRRRWTRVHRGIWFTLERTLTFQDWLYAGQLIYGPNAAIGGNAALHILGAVEAEPETIDFWVPPSQKYAQAAGSRLRVHRDFGDRLLRKDSSGPMISFADALVDVLNTSTDHAHVANTIINARKRAPRLRERLSDVLPHRKRIRHRALLDYLMTCVPAFDSVLEYFWITHIEKPHGIRPSTRQWVCPDGYKRDGAWVDLQTIYELDGDAYHLNVNTLRRDRDKDLAARQRGFMTLRFRYADVVHHSCNTAAKLRDAVPGLGVEPCSDTCSVHHLPG